MSRRCLPQGVHQTLDRRHFGGRNKQILVLRPDAELVAAPEEICLAGGGTVGIVHADVVHVHAALILTVESAHVHLRVVRLEHHGDAVQLVTVLVEHAPGHTPYTATPKWRSKAAVK